MLTQSKLLHVIPTLQVWLLLLLLLQPLLLLLVVLLLVTRLGKTVVFAFASFWRTVSSSIIIRIVSFMSSFMSSLSGFASAFVCGRLEASRVRA